MFARFAEGRRPVKIEAVQATNTATVLDHEQLRDITLDDPDLMREILAALIDDTGRQIELLGGAIEDRDSQRCIRLAHYSKGACANVGAVSSATLLKDIEREAAHDQFEACSSALASLVTELGRLREEAGALAGAGSGY